MISAITSDVIGLAEYRSTRSIYNASIGIDVDISTIDMNYQDNKYIPAIVAYVKHIMMLKPEFAPNIRGVIRFYGPTVAEAVNDTIDKLSVLI